MGPPRAGRLRRGAAPALLLLLGLSLRAGAVARKVPWFDEFLTGNFVREGWGGLLASLRREAHPPLYFLIAKAWAIPFGDSMTSLKALSVACGVAALALLWALLRRTHGTVAAFAGSVLFACSGVQIDQASDAKPYALLALALVALLASVARAAEEPESPWREAAAVAAAAVCCSVHFYGAAAAVAVTLAAAMALRGPARRVALLAFAVAALVSAAWLSAALRLPAGASDYIRDIWKGTPFWAPAAVAARISMPGWRPPYPPMRGSVFPGVTAIEAAAAVLVVVLLAAGGAARSRTPAAPARRFLLAAVLVLGPGFLLLGVAMGLAGRPVALPGRFEVVTQLGLAVAVAGSVARLGRGRRAAAAALLLAGLWASVPAWTPRLRGPRAIRREEWLVRALEAGTPPGRSVVVVTLGLSRPPIEYYADGDPRLRLVSFPASQARHPGWRSESVSPGARAELAAEAGALADALEQSLARGIPVFLAMRPDPRNGILLSRLDGIAELRPTPFASWFYRLVPAPIHLAYQSR